MRFWLGLAGIAVAEVLLFRGQWFVTHFFTPIVWTAYILLADGLLERLRGSSPMTRDRGAFAWLCVASIAIWCIFEAYNLRMQGWRYLELPESPALRLLGYAWSFGTIAPGVLLTAELIGHGLYGAGRPAPPRSELRTLSRRAAALSVTGGGLCLVSPFLVPQDVSRYLWAPVWAGFIFAADPVNGRLGRISIWREVISGHWRRLVGLLGAGLFCGALWEFWNYWSVTRWVYTFPIVAHVKVFEMPSLGFLGFPPFAVECFVLVELASGLWGGSADLQSRRHRA
jgi:hypothetical protein